MTNKKDPLSLNEFEYYLENHKLADKTIKEYMLAVRLLIKNYNVEDLYSPNKNLVGLLREFIFQRHSPMYRGAMFHYFSYLGIRTYYDRFCKENMVGLRALKKPKNVKIILNLNQIKQLIDTLPFHISVESQLQYDTLTRVQSLLNLKKTQFSMDDEGNHRILLVGKGNKHRTKFVSPQVAKRVSEYMSTHSDELIFPFNYNHVRHILHKVGQTLFGLNITTHTFKRSRGIHLVEKGYDFPTIQKMLDHSDPRTTITYIEQASTHSKKVMLKEKEMWD